MGEFDQDSGINVGGEEIIPDENHEPTPDFQKNVAIHIPLLEDDDYDMVIGQVEVVGDTATIKLADGSSFISHLTEDGSYLSLSIKRATENNNG